MEGDLNALDRKISANADDRRVWQQIYNKGLLLAYRASTYQNILVEKYLVVATKVGGAEEVEDVHKDLGAVCRKLREFSTRYPKIAGKAHT